MLTVKVWLLGIGVFLFGIAVLTILEAIEKRPAVDPSPNPLPLPPGPDLGDCDPGADGPRRLLVGAKAVNPCPARGPDGSPDPAYVKPPASPAPPRGRHSEGPAMTVLPQLDLIREELVSLANAISYGMETRNQLLARVDRIEAKVLAARTSTEECNEKG